MNGIIISNQLKYISLISLTSLNESPEKPPILVISQNVFFLKISFDERFKYNMGLKSW